jgi:hypothetical protein
MVRREEEQYLIHGFNGLANQEFSKNSKNQAFDLAPSLFTLPRETFL